MYPFATLLAVSSALAQLPAQSVVYNPPIDPQAEYWEGEVIVGFKGSDLPNELVVGGLHLLRDDDIFGQDAAVYLMEEDGRVPEVVSALRRRPDVLFAEPNYVVHALSALSDTYYSLQWNLQKIDVEDAWYYSSGSKAAVAVIDSGVTSGTADGLGTYWGGYDYVGKDWDPKDEYGHGTFVASVLANAGNNSKGIAGVGYSAPIRSYRVLDSSGTGSSADVASAIGFADYEKVKVINMSVGSTSYSAAVATAVSTAHTDGIVLVAASGKTGTSTLNYPAGLPYVLAVGGIDNSSKRASYSNYGSTSYGGVLDLMAPGGDTSVDADADGYPDGVIGECSVGGSWTFCLSSGTSLAAPQVSAAASILMSMGASASETESCLTSTAKDLGSAGYDIYYGYGMVQIEDALGCFLDWDALFSTGSGALGSWTMSSSDKITRGDMDADGMAELMQYNGKSWMIQEWNGSGWTKITSGTDTFTGAPAFGDFNGDGKDELLVRAAGYYGLFKLSSGSLSIVSSTTPGSWTSSSSDKLAVGDFDGDGADEVFVSNATSAHLLDYSSSTGKWSSTKTWSGKIGATSSWTLSSADRLVAGDLDGDGYDELFVTNDSSATLLDDSRSWTKLYATGSSGLSSLWKPASGDSWVAADFDGDGKDSLMALSASAAQMMNYASGAWTSTWSESTGIIFWWSQGSSDQWVAGDMDGDGRAELQAFTGTWSQLMEYLD